MQYVHIELFFITLTWIEPRINGLGPQRIGLQGRFQEKNLDFTQKTVLISVRVLKEFVTVFYCKTCIV